MNQRDCTHGRKVGKCADCDVARLETENAALRKALKPFADYEAIRQTMGGTTPKSGTVWACESKHGAAEITAEHMQAAIAAMKGTP